MDQDEDGDLDAIVGTFENELAYFENIGSASAPTFVERTGAANPVARLTFAEAYTNIVLSDLDGDGDLDAVTGSEAGPLAFHRSSLRVPIFLDGFESGDTTAWSAAVP